MLEPYCEGSEEYMEEIVEYTREEAIEYGKDLAPDIESGCENWTDDQFYEWAKDELGYESNEEGSLVYRMNSNAQFDFAVIGGRWANSLKSKQTGQYANSVKIKDIDWLGMKKDNLAAINFDVYSQNEKQDILDTYGSVEKWKDIESNFSTRSLIVPEEGWITLGNVESFGLILDKAEKRQKWLERYKDIVSQYENREYYLTIVDCHV